MTTDARLKRPPESCLVCGRTRAEAAQLIVGPDLFLCDRCIDDASGVLLAGDRSAAGRRRERGRCMFCEHDVEGELWERDPAWVCAGCLDLLNETLYEALGPESLRPVVCLRVEKMRKRSEREERKLEMALLSRRSASLKQEIVGANLGLLVQNVKDLLEKLEGAEGVGLLRAVSLPRQREAVHVFERLVRVLRGRPSGGREAADGPSERGKRA